MRRAVVGIETFIRENLRLAPVPLVPKISLYMAHPGSGLSRLPTPLHDPTAPPYWAYAWAGGLALARYVLDHPHIVSSRRVLDLGSGSGLVAIAAVKASAAHAAAAEIDAHARAAARLNAAVNDVVMEIVEDDMLDCPPPADFDLILAGDVFYDAAVAERMTRYFTACRTAGIDVLVGDPGRCDLPHDHLTRLASYMAPDFGMAPDDRSAASHVFRFNQSRPNVR